MAGGPREVRDAVIIALAIMAVAVLLSGCAKPPSSAEAICEGTLDLRRGLARALVQDGGDQSAMAGQWLLSALKDACATMGEES